MKRLLLIAVALGLSACAHETTELDREALLKIIDNAKPQASNVIVTPSTPAPIVNVTQNNNAPQADVCRGNRECLGLSIKDQALWPQYLADINKPKSDLYQDQPAMRVCSTMPKYNTEGRQEGMVTYCDGVLQSN